LLHFVPTPIGNLEDISLRSLKLLESAQIVFCEDTRVAKKLISLLKERNSIIPVEKQYVSMHSHNEQYVLTQLSPDMFDQDVIYLSDAGMPAVSDPGCILISYAQKHGIKHEVIPGANALLVAYASSGFCQTQFLFYGFLPHKGKDRKESLQRAMYSGFVTILYESPHRILKLIDQICEIEPNREIFLIKEISKYYSSSFKAKAFEIQEQFKEQNIKGEWVVVLDRKEQELGIVTVDDILELDIPKKQASKLIAKITKKSPKECYKELLSH
jgi:16S rRNA (cytidine1402-2'-O)-methyltransferase